MKTLLSLLALGLSLTVAAHAQPLKLSVDTKGVVVDGGPSGLVTIAAPVVVGTDGKDRKPVLTPGADGLSAQAAYSDGFAINISVSASDGTIRYDFDASQANAKTVRLNASLPVATFGGGTFATNGGQPLPFPAETGKQLVTQGAFTRMDVSVASGSGLSFSTPASYQQLQDNRIWNTSSFSWIYHYDLLRYPNSSGFALKVSLK
jgi:hypothetical protein